MKLTFLKQGTVVYLKNEGIIPKLNSRYKGPYTIIKRDEWNNYILKDSTGAEVEDKFPLSKLKVVKKTIEKESFEVEKILNHKTVKNKIKFLVKWKNHNASNNSWEPESNFNFKVLINRYWESIQKSKPERKSKRVISTNLSVLTICFIIPM